MIAKSQKHNRSTQNLAGIKKAAQTVLRDSFYSERVVHSSGLKSSMWKHFCFYKHEVIWKGFCLEVFIYYF